MESVELRQQHLVQEVISHQMCSFMYFHVVARCPKVEQVKEGDRLSLLEWDLVHKQERHTERCVHSWIIVEDIIMNPKRAEYRCRMFYRVMDIDP